MGAIAAISDSDTRVVLWCQRWRAYPRLMAGGRALSHSGDGYLQLATPLLLWWLWPAGGKALLLDCLLLFAIERPLYWLLKRGLQRRRPAELLHCFEGAITPADRFSFPSGHTMAASALAASLMTHLGAVAALAAVWAAAVGCSRVLLGVHFPSDVLAGAGIGGALALAVSSV